MAAPPKLRERERERKRELSFVWQLCESFGSLWLFIVEYDIVPSLGH